MKLLPVYLSGITVRNLKNISINFNSEEIVLLTGVSGSGKSSIAFDTLYAAGRKQYISTLPTFFAAALKSLPNPKVEKIYGLSPTIAIKQNHFSYYSHATLGSTTELFSHLALLFSLEGQARDPKTKVALNLLSKEKVLATIMELPEGIQLTLLAPLLYKDTNGIRDYVQQGFTKVRLNGSVQPIYSFLTTGIPENTPADIVVDTLVKIQNNTARLKVSLFTALELGGGQCAVLVDTELLTFSTNQQINQVTYTPLTPQLFSPHVLGSRCCSCQGSGIFISIDDPILINQDLSIKDNCCSFAGNCSSYLHHAVYQAFADALKFSLETPWKDLPLEIQNIFLRGKSNLVLPVRLFDPTLGKKNLTHKVWRGVLNDIGDKVRYTTKPSRYLPKGMSAHRCSLCKGTGLGEYASVATWEGKTFAEFQDMSINLWYALLSEVKAPSLCIREVLQGLKQRLSFLIDLGLGYLTPNRALSTLSGGEQERTAIAKYLGGELFGITYILDEPSIGLHPQDTDKLIRVIQKLRNQGNTIILVEHDEHMISFADRIIDIGPGAGSFGGEVLFNGSPKDFLTHSETLTAKYLRQELAIQIPESRGPPRSWLSLRQAVVHNLKNLSIRLPLARLTAVTGVSGSGKSSLINDTLVPTIESFLNQENPENLEFQGSSIDRLIHITRDLPGRSQRSIPLTYLKAFDEVRELFASQKRSQRQGFTKAHFSFNQPQGACITCQGLGIISISEDEMPIPCSECKGKRYQPQILEILYEGKSIADILDMTVYQAQKFFTSCPKIYEKIHALSLLRLDYLPLGRPLSTLSGGEIQRLKLAHELLFSSSKPTLYVLDEPTTGLHTHDIQALIEVLLSLTYLGHTVIVIEHNMHVVKVSDYVLELGPEGGNDGGYLLASCPPKDLIHLDTPTAKALAPYIQDSLTLPVLRNSPPRLEDPTSGNIIVKDAHENNLKHLDLSLPRNALVAIVGPGASGKHSLVFDILYASGNIAYAELFPTYIRQGLLKETPLPHVGEVKGLSPVISVRKCTSRNHSHHTLASALGLSNSLEKLFAILGEPFSPVTGEKLFKISSQTIIDTLLKNYEDHYVTITSPIPSDTDLNLFLQAKQKEGFLKLYSQGNIYDLDQKLPKDLTSPSLVIQHLKISLRHVSALFSALSVAFSLSSKIQMYILDGEETLELSYSLGWKDLEGRTYPEVTHELLSCDHPEGRCHQCGGTSQILRISLEHHQDKFADYTPLELCNLFFPNSSMQSLEHLLKLANISSSKPLGSLTSETFQILCKGSSEFLGMNTLLQDQLDMEVAAPLLKPLLFPIPCPSCKGSGLNDYARHIRIGETSLLDIYEQDTAFLYSFLKDIETNDTKSIVQDLMNRLTFITKVGLDYITLGQRQDTLSDGESYRLHLAKKISTNLTNIVYLFEEPLSGLHPEDLPIIIRLFKELIANHNTVIATDRSYTLVPYADYTISLGPGSGPKGGFLVDCDVEVLPKSNSNSSSAKKVFPSKTNANSKVALNSTLKVNLSIYHIQNLKVSAPLHSLVAIGGISGSGKTSLLLEGFKKQAEVLLSQGTRNFSNILVIDSHPIASSQRSDISTYFDIAPSLRSFYASLMQAKALNISASMFSTNTKQGQCIDCQGLGYQLVDRAFYALEKRPCPTCSGFRIQPLAQEVLYEGKHFGELLHTPIETIATLFPFIKKIQKPIKALLEIGLGYLPIGQNLASLSISEKTALKVAYFLYQPPQFPTLFLIDELFTSLDLKRKQLLPEKLKSLVAAGHSIIYIDHDVELLKCADYLIEIGPGSGKQGGKLLFAGPPKDIYLNESSLLKKYVPRD